MTSQSAIFDRRVNQIAPVEASLKSILIRYIWKSWNSYSLQVKELNMYINQSENSKSPFTLSEVTVTWLSKISIQ